MELIESEKLPLLPTSHDKDLMKIVLAAAGKFGPGSLQSFSEISLKKDEKIELKTDKSMLILLILRDGIANATKGENKITFRTHDLLILKENNTFSINALDKEINIFKLVWVLQ